MLREPTLKNALQARSIVSLYFLRFQWNDQEFLPECCAVNKEYYLKLMRRYVEQSEEGAWSCGKTINGICYTIIHLLTKRWLFVIFWPITTLYSYHSYWIYYTWHPLTFPIPKIVKTVEKIKLNYSSWSTDFGPNGISN